MIGLGEAEATNPLAGRELRQVFLSLRLRAELQDRQHHQRGLHAHHRAIAGVDALDLARDQPVTDVVQPRAAVFIRNGRPEQAEFAHFAKDRDFGRFVAEGIEHPWREPPLRVGLCRVAHHAFFGRKLGLQQEGIVPVEACARTRHFATPDARGIAPQAIDLF